MKTPYLLCFAVGFIYSPISLAQSNSIYKTINDITKEECIQTCQDEAATQCRGMMFKTTGASTLGTCQLDNGQGANSLFQVSPPDKIDLQIALKDLNDYRRSHGLRPVELNSNLSKASQIHATDMAKTGRLSHTGSDLSLIHI